MDKYVRVQVILFCTIMFECGFLMMVWGKSLLISGVFSMGDASNAPISIPGYIYILGCYAMFLAVLTPIMILLLSSTIPPNLENT